MQDHAGEKAFHPGAAGGRETEVRGTERPGKARPAEEAPGAGRLMSRSKKWRLEWSFFLGGTAGGSITRSVLDAPMIASRVSGRF